MGVKRTIWTIVLIVVVLLLLGVVSLPKFMTDGSGGDGGNSGCVTMAC